MDITVIIPVYNVEEFLVDCLESVKRNVEDLDAEVLMIDDGSTDNSSAIANLYAEEIECFYYYRTENGGLSRARNYGASLAKGKYLFFIDSDDMLVDGILRKMLETAEKNHSEVTICHFCRIKDKKYATTNASQRIFFGLKESVSHITRHPNFVYDCSSWNKLILRSFYLQNDIKFPDGYMHEDLLPMLKLHYCCNKVSVIYETGYLWRIRTGANKSITQLVNKKSFTDKIAMMARTLTYARHNSLNPEIVFALEVKFLNYGFDSWFNKLHLLPQDEAMEYVELLARFIKEYAGKDALSSISLIQQQIYQDVLQGDLDHLLKVINYKNANYSRVPVLLRNGNLELNLPDYLFTIKNRKVDGEFGIHSLPKCTVNAVEIDEYFVYLKGYLYVRRINAPFNCVPYFKALLLNEDTGNAVVLKLDPVEIHNITESQGNILNYDDYQFSQYDYDGAGFCISIDFDKLIKDMRFKGKNFIIIDFDFVKCNGSYLLQGISGNAKKALTKFVYRDEKNQGTFDFDEQNIISIEINSLNDDNSAVASPAPVPFNSTVAGKRMQAMKKENDTVKKQLQAMKKENDIYKKQLQTVKKESDTVKKQLQTIKQSTGFKFLTKLYRLRDFMLGKTVKRI